MTLAVILLAVFLGTVAGKFIHVAGLILFCCVLILHREKREPYDASLGSSPTRLGAWPLPQAGASYLLVMTTDDVLRDAMTMMLTYLFLGFLPCLDDLVLCVHMNL